MSRCFKHYDVKVYIYDKAVVFLQPVKDWRVVYFAIYGDARSAPHRNK
jgi:hypothetical protein